MVHGGWFSRNFRQNFWVMPDSICIKSLAALDTRKSRLRIGICYNHTQPWRVAFGPLGVLTYDLKADPVPVA
jgi:hypothetical protein